MGGVDALVVEGPLPLGLRGRIGATRLILALDRPDAPLPAEAPDAVLLAARAGCDVAALGARLAVHEAERGWPDGQLRILAQVAAPLGVLEARSFVGASPRLDGLGLDEAALAVALGAEAAGETLAQARALVRLAAAAAGARTFAYSGPDGIEHAVAAARQEGFGLLITRDPSAVL
ncbi:aldolase/citrate lyase family protein [Methylobacterium sp. Leaf456]|uniref:aldolase/citrate lyase family protein n=1 Tax=Methylobacterium sp. Leaf456 TaxID=1736382 RepID=UPI002570D367|nr:aldolase/citrate lyase family protein [Methylobacterium sp. Leaf456]